MKNFNENLGKDPLVEIYWTEAMFNCRNLPLEIKQDKEITFVYKWYESELLGYNNSFCREDVVGILKKYGVEDKSINKMMESLLVKKLKNENLG